MVQHAIETEETAGREKRFDVLHLALAEYHQRFISVGLSGTGFVLVVIGWIATSDKVQKLLKLGQRVRLEGSTALFLALIAYLLLSLRMLRNMRDIKRRLDDLAYIPKQYYAFRLPSRWAAFIFLMLNVMVTTIAVLLLWVNP
jgi:hypothetical protein